MADNYDGWNKPTRKVKVRVAFDVEITVPADWDEHQIEFYVEENGCPGTGGVGNAVDDVVEKLHAEMTKSDDDGYCWACGWDERGVGNGESKVVEIEGMRPAAKEQA